MGALRPADQQAEEVLRKIPPGEYLFVDISRPRNGKFHRLFFALLSVVHENMNDEARQKWPTVDRLLWEVKMQTGYFDVAESVGGKPYYIPHSISFAGMDDDAFSEFFSKALDVCRRYIIPGVTEPELRAAVDAEIARYG